MMFLTRNFELVKNREKTYLTAPSAVNATTLTVKAVDSNSWADNDWIIVGEIGSENAEVLQINGSVTDGTSLTVDRGGSNGARYTHSIDEPVYRIDYDQIEMSHASTVDGSKTVLATNELQVDDVYTRYEDTANVTGFGFTRFKNSTTGVFSAYSSGIPYTGYPAKSLGRMMKMVRRLLNEPDFRFITDEDIYEEINEMQRDIAHERLWPFYETIRSNSSVANQRNYDVDADVVIGKPHTVVFQAQPLAKVDATRFDMLNWNTHVTGQPTHASIWNNQIRLYPIPTSSADTTTLNGALSASATSITVADNSGFSPTGRLIIDSEVISYTGLSGTTSFVGCVRGEEDTTAATHSSGATVTERDLIYTSSQEPTELKDISDETQIPDPGVLTYGSAMNLAIGKLNDQVLHDRLRDKYLKGIEMLRDKFGRKFTSQYYQIKDRDEVVLDTGRWRNPNDYSEITGS